MPTFFRIFLFALVVTFARAAAEPVTNAPSHPLVWDALEKSLEVKAEDNAARFEFSVTNTSDRPIEITAIKPSCGCTLAEMARQPWVIAPGEKGSFSAVVDYRGKHGKFSKMIFVHSEPGPQTLQVTLNVADSPEAARERNRQLAGLDRQNVFRGDCASCHAVPTAGKTGEELFQAACAICHASESRAAMVPDLMKPREPRDEAYWLRWISEGKEGTLMPAFAQKHRGPLSDAQIASLVEYALKRLPTAPQSN